MRQSIIHAALAVTLGLAAAGVPLWADVDARMSIPASAFSLLQQLRENLDDGRMLDAVDHASVKKT